MLLVAVLAALGPAKPPGLAVGRLAPPRAKHSGSRPLLSSSLHEPLLAGGLHARKLLEQLAELHGQTKQMLVM